MHGAAAADLDTVETVARENGLTVSRRRDRERYVVLSGTLEALLRVFPADVGQCRVGEKSYRFRQGTIGVPSSLADIVTGVFGYDTRPKAAGASHRWFWTV